MGFFSPISMQARITLSEREREKERESEREREGEREGQWQGQWEGERIKEFWEWETEAEAVRGKEGEVDTVRYGGLYSSVQSLLFMPSQCPSRSFFNLSLSWNSLYFSLSASSPPLLSTPPSCPLPPLTCSICSPSLHLLFAQRWSLAKHQPLRPRNIYRKESVSVISSGELTSSGKVMTEST
jgi:hypothetical protein